MLKLFVASSFTLCSLMFSSIAYLQTGGSQTDELFYPAMVPQPDWQPKQQESDAFIKTYTFSVIKALTKESIDFKVESGAMAPEVAACVNKKIQYKDLLIDAKPMVAEAFSSGASLKGATDFYLSVTGKKLRRFNAETLGKVMRSKLRRQKPVIPTSMVPPDFDDNDTLNSQKFSQSVSGLEFQAFAKDGLPKLRTKEILQTAIKACQ